MAVDESMYREDAAMVYEAVRGLGTVRPGYRASYTEADAVYARNQILDVMGMDEYEEPAGYGGERGPGGHLKGSFWTMPMPARALKEDSVVYRDLS
ncbi:MAG: hypothetical protein ACLTW9_17415 [Enterocloster sp.]